MKALITLVTILFLAQVGYPGGQYPPGQYPPGQYPPGQYPGTGGGGIPFPRRSKKTTTTSEKKDADVQTTSFRGVVRQLDAKSFDIEAEDTRLITVQLTEKTTKPKNLEVGDSVDVTAREDGKGGFLADTVTRLDKPANVENGSPRSASAAKAEEDAPREPSAVQLKGPKYDEGDTGPPTLRRGQPPPRKRPAETETEVAGNTAPSDRPTDRPTLRLGAPPVQIDPRQAFIDKAREQAEGFLTGLPNYVCQEFTTRYVSEGKSDWHALDVVSLEVVYQDGKEDYRNIAINGKPWKKPVEESGAWSTGEFGTVLRDLFSPATAAKFKYIKDSTVAGFPAHIYDFQVDRQHSHWKVSVVAQYVLPAYAGSIWLDKKEGRPLRIEMQAKQLPADFPEDTVESSVDYGYVSLGTEKFFVPLKAEVLSCHRGTSQCDRNVIEFRNYHRFTGESNITFK